LIVAICTIVGNSAVQGGAFYSYEATPTINNCIVRDNGPEQIEGTASITYSNIQGGWEGEGNIDADPCFALDSDYHLIAGSPCIDSGDLNFIPAPGETDLEGKQRVITGVVDMGVYEFEPDTPSIAVSSGSFNFVSSWLAPQPQKLQIKNCGTGTLLRWKITEDCDWLDVKPKRGQSAGQVNEVELSVDVNGLSMGSYYGQLAIEDKKANNSPVTINVVLHNGRILRVRQDFPTIQSAIDAARGHDVVLVADGTYTGDGNRDLDFKGKAITVRSENGPENCIIDCNGETGEHRAFYFHNYETAASVVQGLTLTGGNTEGNGGAILLAASSPTIRECIINNNTAYREGGAIFCGAGGYYGMDTASCPSIENCRIINNTANRFGGGISCDGSNPKISGCTISGNSLTRCRGGGIYIERCHIIKIDNSIISGNSAFRGGGIYVNRGYLELTGCTIVGNTCDRAKGYGGGGVEGRGSCVINSCIIWDNWPNQIRGFEYLTVTYSNIQNGWFGEGNIDLDPCFVVPGYWDANSTPEDANDDFWVEGDYHLLPDSPCIDTGDPNYVPDTNETGLDGNPRLVNGIIDMGAYEWSLPQAVNLIEDLIEYILGLELHNGIENSLIAKLNAALKLLEDDSEENDGAAVNILTAFINAVEAQSGKKIGQADADELIIAAEQIIEELTAAAQQQGSENPTAADASVEGQPLLTGWEYPACWDYPACWEYPAHGKKPADTSAGFLILNSLRPVF